MTLSKNKSVIFLYVFLNLQRGTAYLGIKGLTKHKIWYKILIIIDTLGNSVNLY